MSLEETRRYHEERERAIECFSKELQFSGRNNKEVINSEHRQYNFLDRYLEVSNRLKECYEDKLNLRKEEIGKLAVNNDFAEFYDRLTNIKDYHKKNPDEIVGPLSMEYEKYSKIRENPEEASAAIVHFTDEESYGKFLDMHACYQTYINLKGFKTVDYVSYLNNFDKLYELPKDKKTVAYAIYLKQVLEYLDDFIARAKPMYNFTHRKEIEEMEIDFQNQWDDGKFKGWLREANSAMANHGAQHLDLSVYTSAEELASVGLARLKSALIALDIKCGGTLEERAQKLWATKGLSNEDLAKMSAKGCLKGPILKREQHKEIAHMEARIYFNMVILREERAETIENVQRKQARTLNELEDDEESEEENEVPNESNENDENSTIYNPKNLPLDWDGKPIPYWLYKLHGLNMYYTCEICGNETYRGPKAFQQHFSEWRHAHGMRCLNIPNTAQFQNITKINEAIALWKKINVSKADLHHKVEEEEFEDSQGNVISKRVYEDLKRQGIL